MKLQNKMKSGKSFIDALGRGVASLINTKVK